MSGLALFAVMMSAVPGATAATTREFATWGAITGTSNDFATTMQLPATGFPEATVTSDSRSDVALPTGATNWFGENTPPGLEYGSSRDRAYLNLRPRADNATSPSTTTYTFDRATPQGWTFVLGDIDADQVAVSATRADGTRATAAELGFRGGFNLCDTTPRPSSVCASNGRPKDVPTWNAATATLTGNAGAVDSDGATGWFEPTTSLRTVTFTFTRRGGFPVFQTWFAVARQDVSGTVSVTSGTCDVTASTVSLLDAAGAVVAQQSVGPTGSYAFAGVAASAGYRVALSGVPASCITTGPSSRPIDLTTGDATADFTVREVVPVPISGQVTDGTDPIEGVTVTLTPTGGGPAKTATTGVDGRYIFDDNPDNTTYTISATPPDGYLPATDRTATIADGATAPITGQDFVLPALPQVPATGSVAGTVTLDGRPLPSVEATIRSSGGAVTRVATNAEGAYEFGGLPAGTYEITVGAPSRTSGGPARTITITATGEIVTGQDFAFTTDAPRTDPAEPADPADPAQPIDTPVEPDEAGSGVLPDTGGPSSVLPLAGLLLLAVGSCLVVAARPRNS